MTKCDTLLACWIPLSRSASFASSQSAALQRDENFCRNQRHDLVCLCRWKLQFQIQLCTHRVTERDGTSKEKSWTGWCQWPNDHEHHFDTLIKFFDDIMSQSWRSRTITSWSWLSTRHKSGLPLLFYIHTFFQLEAALEKVKTGPQPSIPFALRSIGFWVGCALVACCHETIDLQYSVQEFVISCQQSTQ